MKLTLKEKILIPMIVLVLIVLVWQLFLLISNRPQHDIHVDNATKLLPTVKVAEQAVKLNQASSYAANPASSIESAAQQQYLKLVNQYQYSQVKRMIASDKEAIAVAERNEMAAELEAVKSRKQLSQMGAAPKALLVNQQASKVPQQRLVYTGQQQGVWSAVVRENDHLAYVSVGSKLNDGAVVKVINKREIVLEKNNDRFALSFQGKQALPQVAAPMVTVAVKTPPKPIVAKPVAKATPVQTVVAEVEKSVTENKVDRQVADITHHILMRPVLNPVLQKRQVKQIVTANYSAAEQGLLRQSPHEFTVQLIFDPKRSAVLEYIKQHQLQGKVSIFQAKNKGKIWYGLVYGHFPTATAAANAIREYPEDMRIWKPFVRRFGSLQQEIRVAAQFAAAQSKPQS